MKRNATDAEMNPVLKYRKNVEEDEENLEKLKANLAKLVKLEGSKKHLLEVLLISTRLDGAA